VADAQRGTDITDAKLAYRTRNEGDFPEKLNVLLQRAWDLKYGENPCQHAAMYNIAAMAGNAGCDLASLTDITSVRSDGKGKGGLSLTNTMDIARAMDSLKWFREQTCVILKHNIVSGFATQTLTGTGQRTDVELYQLARDSDRRSNFGGTVTFNYPVTLALVDALFELYRAQGYVVDVIAAPEYEQGVLGAIERASNNVRVAKFSNLDKIPKFPGDDTHGLLDLKPMPTGRVGVQQPYLSSITGADKLIKDPMVVDKQGTRHVVQRDPTKAELEDLLTAWWLNISGARSNGIVLVRDGVLVSMGSGQVERVGAVEQAIIKGMHKAMDREGLKYDPLMGIAGCERLKDNPFKGAACSSDAFFPFPDSVALLARTGVSAVVQPFGSVNDAAVIDEANEHNMAMCATLERCFGHF